MSNVYHISIYQRDLKKTLKFSQVECDEAGNEPFFLDSLRHFRVQCTTLSNKLVNSIGILEKNTILEIYLSLF